MSLSGLRVLCLESRRAAEIETLVRKQGGDPFVAPSLRERPLGDHSDAFRLAERLESGEVELLVLMTGVGLSFWRDIVGAERADKALRKAMLVARGPKPSSVLRANGLAPDLTIPEPNTWREIVEALRKRPERTIAVQEYGRPNDQFTDALRALGATVETFALYKWELPEDTGPLRKAVKKLVEGEIDLVLFTAGVQIDHLFQIAAEEGLSAEVLKALSERCVTGSIGPITNEALAARSLQADIIPQSPKMGALVLAASTEAVSALKKKLRGQRKAMLYSPPSS